MIVLGVLGFALFMTFLWVYTLRRRFLTLLHEEQPEQLEVLRQSNHAMDSSWGSSHRLAQYVARRRYRELGSPALVAVGNRLYIAMRTRTIAWVMAIAGIAWFLGSIARWTFN